MDRLRLFQASQAKAGCEKFCEKNPNFPFHHKAFSVKMAFYFEEHKAARVPSESSELERDRPFRLVTMQPFYIEMKKKFE